VRSRALIIAFLAALVMPLAAVTPAAAQDSGDVAIAVSDNYFDANDVTVSVGATVTFTNVGFDEHTATADRGAFDSDILDPGQSYSYTFTTPGTYTYFCIFHDGMDGTITVI
jgi:plastocyanin